MTQAEPQNIEQTVNQLSKSAIDLAEAASNYGALKVIFGVFMVVVLVIIVLFIWQIIFLNRKVHNMDNHLEELAHLAGNTDKTIGSTEASSMIRRSLNSYNTLIKYSILRIRYENNIQDEDRVKAKVNRVVENHWNELSNFLMAFTCKGSPLSNIILNEDLSSIKAMLIEYIYLPKETFSINQMDNSIDLFFEGLKITYLRQIPK